MTRAEPQDRCSPLDRFAFPLLGRRSSDYFVEALCMARNTRERVWCHLLGWIPRRLRNRVLRAHGFPQLRQWPADVSAVAVERWLVELTARRNLVGSADAIDGGRIDMSLSDRRTPRGAVVFLFSSRQRDPVAVVKIRPSAAGRTSVPREARTLRALNRTLPPLLRPTIPGLLAWHRAHGTDVLLLTGLPGRSAYVDLHRDLRPRRRVAMHFRHAAEWLARFHLATSQPSRPIGSEELDRIVGRALAAEAVAAPGLEPTWLSRLREQCASKPLVPVASHGDFWARNLLLANPRMSEHGSAAVGVVDWERFRRRTLPSDDLFHFPLTYGLAFPWSCYRRANAETAFSRTFLDDNEVSRAVACYFTIYCRLTGFDPDLLRPLFHLFLLTRAEQDAGASLDGRARWTKWNQLLASSHRSVLDGVAQGGA